MSAGPDFISLLVEMGFSKDRAEKGLSMTDHQSVEAAVEWIFSNPGESDPGSSQRTSAGASQQNSLSDRCNLFQTPLPRQSPSNTYTSASVSTTLSSLSMSITSSCPPSQFSNINQRQSQNSRRGRPLLSSMPVLAIPKFPNLIDQQQPRQPQPPGLQQSQQLGQ